MFSTVMSFSSESRLVKSLQAKCEELGRHGFEGFLERYFDNGGGIYLDDEPVDYWACWGAGVLGERPVAEKWELALAAEWSTSEIRNRIWSYVSSRQPIPGCVSLLALRLELINRGEDPHGYHNT